MTHHAPVPDFSVAFFSGSLFPRWLRAVLCVSALLSLAVAAPAAPADVLTEAQARERSARVSEVSYDLLFTFRAGEESYAGDATLKFTLKDAASALRLDFKDGGEVRLNVNGREVTQPVTDGAILMLAPEWLRQGPNEVRVAYRNRFDQGASGVHRTVDPADGREYVYTHFEPYFAHRLFPCFDQPDLKARMRVAVVAPKAWAVVSNYPEERTRPAAEGVRHDFAVTPPLSTYLLFVGAGDYAKLIDPRAEVPSRLFVRRSMVRYARPQCDEIFDVTRRGLRFYADYFGTPYPFVKYDQIFVPEFHVGAMENAGAVAFNEYALFRHQPTRTDRLKRAEVILHEMAHMWFGDLVTMRWWDGLWLNESFATYISYVALTGATEFTEAFQHFASGNKSWAYWQDQLVTTHPVSGQVLNTDTAFSNFDGITYGKGAALLSQLSFFLGPEKFRKGLASYFREHAWGNTDRADFFADMSRAAGVDLGAWSHAHLETSGVNVLVPRVELDGGGRVRALSLEQQKGNGDGLLREQRLEVALYTAGADGKLQLWKAVPVTMSGASTPVPAASGAPAPAFVWANHGDHAYARVMLDEPSLKFALAHLEAIEDGLTRRGVWLTLWEMVREARLAPQAFLDAFAAKAPLEHDPLVVEALARSVGNCLESYVPRTRIAAFEKLHDVIWKQVGQAAAGSDFQKVWFNLALTTAAGPAGQARLEELLDGKLTVKGIELDPEKRWKMVSALANQGRPGARQRIEAELRRDATDFGRRKAIAAEAALPEAAGKARFWQQFATDTHTATAMLESAMDGFQRPGQAELTRPYIARYFDEIPALARSRDQEYVDMFVDNLFPKFLFEQATVERTREFLKANPALADDLRKELRNALDELERSMRIQAAFP